MGLWTKLQTELKSAGHAAREAIDEGKVRLEIFRVRQLADKAAQALGYEVFKAKSKGNEIDQEALSRLVATLGEHEAEASRLSAELERHRNGGPPPESPPDSPPPKPAK